MKMTLMNDRITGVKVECPLCKTFSADVCFDRRTFHKFKCNKCNGLFD